MEFPNIPMSWLVALLVIGICTLLVLHIDGAVLGMLMLLVGYVTGKHIEQTKQINKDTLTLSEINNKE